MLPDSIETATYLRKNITRLPVRTVGEWEPWLGHRAFLTHVVKKATVVFVQWSIIATTTLNIMNLPYGINSFLLPIHKAENGNPIMKAAGSSRALQRELSTTPELLAAGQLVEDLYRRALTGFTNLSQSFVYPRPLNEHCFNSSLLPVYENYTNLCVPSPLEQFSILPLLSMHIGSLSLSFTNSSLFMLLTLGLVLLLLNVVTKRGGGTLVPNAWQSLVELIYDFVLTLVNEQIGGLSGNVKQRFFPCILVTFTFLLFCNLQGMIPYSFTVTSHFIITLGLSFSIFIGITLVGLQTNKLRFFSFFLPAGVPLILAPFLVLLELISYCFRALSLGIRLFANMMAGHSLVKILSGFAWTMLCMNDLVYFIGDLGLLFIVLALTGLELGVAILQAYVFTILICIYLNDALNLH